MRRLFVLLLAAALVIAPAFLPSGSDPSWLPVVRVVASVVGPLAGLAIVLRLYRDRLARWLSDELMRHAGPSIIAALPPRVVLSTLLRKIYGEGAKETLLAGVLGGAGLDVHGRDIATSRRTVVDIRLSSVDDRYYDAVITWRHRLSGVLASYKFVVFATCDAGLWNVLPSERRAPLYESWFVDDEDMLQSFVPTLRQNLKVGISYRDTDGAVHTVEPRSLGCTEPPVREWPAYVRLPDWVKSDDVRILEFDLGELVDDDHVVGAIETVSVRAASVERTAHGYMSWSPPYPCYVERIRFDVEDLLVEGDPLLFKILPFSMERPGPTAANSWGKATRGPGAGHRVLAVARTRRHPALAAGQRRRRRGDVWPVSATSWRPTPPSPPVASSFASDATSTHSSPSSAASATRQPPACWTARSPVRHSGGSCPAPTTSGPPIWFPSASCPCGRRRGRACALPIASGPAARRHLAPAVAIVAGQAAALDPRPPRRRCSARTTSRRSTARWASSRPASTSPRTSIRSSSTTSLPHVALVAVLRRDSAGRLGSASTREYPGLVLMPDAADRPRGGRGAGPRRRPPEALRSRRDP